MITLEKRVHDLQKVTILNVINTNRYIHNNESKSILSNLIYPK